MRTAQLHQAGRMLLADHFFEIPGLGSFDLFFANLFTRHLKGCDIPRKKKISKRLRIAHKVQIVDFLIFQLQNRMKKTMASFLWIIG